MGDLQNTTPAGKEYYRISERSGDYRFVDVRATSSAMACAVASQLYDDSFIETYDDWEFESVQRVDKAHDPIDESDYAHEINERDVRSWEETLRKHDGATKQQPRQPTEAELRQLAEWNRCNWPDDPESALDYALRACVAVFDAYITECPGYAGKVMSVVWSGSPTFYDVFVWSNGELVHAERDYTRPE